MNQVLEGVSRVVRVTRTPLSVVALGIVVPAVFSAVILLFAPIHEVAKYVFGGLPWVVVVLVWLQFWSKAKTEPLSASEEYYIQELKYRYPGAAGSELSIEQIELQPRGQAERFNEFIQDRDESDSQP